MRDEKLKKGQIRIIVIATGFPEEGSGHTGAAFERSLFTMPAEVQQETRGKIFNDVMNRRPETPVAPQPTPEAEPVATEERKREEPIVTAAPRVDAARPVTPPVVDEDDEAWGAIPSFLRRHKK
jgi:hypothetical protein